MVAPSETPSEVGVDDAKTAIIVKKEEKKYEKVGEKKKDEKRDEKAKEKKLLVTNDEEVIPVSDWTAPAKITFKFLERRHSPRKREQWCVGRY